MAILFDQPITADYIMTRTNAGVNSANLNSSSISFPSATATVGSALYIGSLFSGASVKRNTSCFRSVNITVNTALVASNCTIVWEYYKSQSNGNFSYTNNWATLTPSTSNPFGTTGSKKITFDIPDDWGSSFVGNPLSAGSENVLWIRMRVTALTGLSSSASSTITVGDNTIEVSGGTTATLADIYDAEVANSWGALSELSDKEYRFNRCGLRAGNRDETTGGTINCTNSKIQFYGLPLGIAFLATNLGVINFGEINTEGYGVKGCAVSFLPKPSGNCMFQSSNGIDISGAGAINFYDTKLFHPYSNNVPNPLGTNNSTGHGSYAINVPANSTLSFVDSTVEDAYAIISNTDNTIIKRTLIIHPDLALRTAASPATVLSDINITQAGRAYFMVSGGGVLNCKNVATSPTANPTYAIWIYSSPAGGGTINLTNSLRTDYNTYFQVAGTVNYSYEANVNVKNNSGNFAGAKVGFWDALNNNVTWQTTDASGNIPMQNLLNNTVTAGAAVPTFNKLTTMKTPHTYKIMHYGYKYLSEIKTVSSSFTDSKKIEIDPYITLTEAQANALTGISINWGTKVITVSGTRTINDLYDYCKAQNIASSSNAFYEQPLITTDGVNFTLNGYTLTITGTLTGLNKVLTGTKTISTGGFFEDSTGAIWNTAGTLYYGSHIYYNVKALTGGTNIANALVSHIDASGNDRTYNTSKVNGALLTDASGNVEGYAVWKIGTTSYSSQTLQVGEYNYQWLSIPKTVNGLSIGSSSSYETNRLVTDSQVTLTKANALLVSGITVSGSTTNINLATNTLTNAYDNLKARQTRTANIETGIKGHLNYYTYGLLVAKDGTTYTLKTGWEFDNFNTSETGTFRNGRIAFATVGTYSLNFFDNTFDFETAGTYDFRNANINGTVNLVNTSGGAVTVLLHPDHLYTNTGPNITVQASVAITIQVNGMTSGSRYQLYDVTNATELVNTTTTGTATYNYTYSTPTTIRLRVMYVSGTSAKQWYEVTGLTSAAGLTFNVNQSDNLVYNANNIDGSTVTECSVSGTTIRIYVDDPDNTTSAQRIYNWYQYYLSTQLGIADQSGTYITSSDQTHYTYNDDMRIVNQDTVNPLSLTGANIVPSSGIATSVFDVTNGASIILNFNRVEAFTYSTGSGLSTAEHNQLFALPTATAITSDIDSNSTQLQQIITDIAGIETDGVSAEEIRVEMDTNSQIAKDAKQAKLNTF